MAFVPDPYFGGPACDFYRRVYADMGVEIALYFDDLWELYKRDPRREAEFTELSAFYLHHVQIEENHA